MMGRGVRLAVTIAIGTSAWLPTPAIASPEHEPNDGPSQASQVVDRRGGTLASQIDVDWYRVDDPGASHQEHSGRTTALSIALTNATCRARGLTVTLTDESGNIIQKKRAFPGRDVTVYFSAENRHLLRIDGEDAPDCVGSTYEVFRFAHFTVAAHYSTAGARVAAVNCQAAAAKLDTYRRAVRRARRKLAHAHGRTRRAYLASLGHYRVETKSAMRQVQKYCTSG
jgi:hypothetical protein